MPETKTPKNQSTDNIEQQIKDITRATVTLSFPPHILSRLAQKAAFVGLTLEEQIEGIVLDAVGSDAGAPVIKGPSTAKHRKISGPSWMNGEPA